MLALLSLFSPVVRSLRAIQQAGELRKFQCSRGHGQQLRLPFAQQQPQ
jgi:hypothetical protein